VIDEKNLVPVLDQFLGFVDEALAEHEASQTKIADLNHRLVESERLLLEKVAAAQKTASPFSEDLIHQTVRQLAELHVVHPHDCAKIAAELRANPAQSLTMLVKISESLLFPKEGMGIPKNTGPEASFDPDGWTDMAAGRPVQIKAK
jgi:hypothetical protein